VSHPLASSEGSSVSTILLWPHVAPSNVRTSKPERTSTDRTSTMRSLQIGQRERSMVAIRDFDLAHRTKLARDIFCPITFH
jgi:hypothetical protein